MKFLTRLYLLFLANCILFVSLAHAEPGTLNFAVGRQDVSYQLLEALFGTVDGVLYGTGTQIIGKMFAVFNAAVLAIGGIFLTYTLLVSTINTAQDGEVMGKKWSSVWIPVRVTFGVGLLVPKASGYCMMQVFVMWLIVQGIGAANQVWSAALGYLQAGGVIAAKPLNASKNADSNGATSILNEQNKTAAGKILEGLVCMEALERALNYYHDAVLEIQEYAFPAPPSVPDFFGTIQIQPGAEVAGIGYQARSFPFPNFGADEPYRVLNGICGTLTVDPTKVGSAKKFAEILKGSEQAAQAMEGYRQRALSVAASDRATRRTAAEEAQARAEALASGKLDSWGDVYGGVTKGDSWDMFVESGKLAGQYTKSAAEGAWDYTKAAGQQVGNAVVDTGKGLGKGIEDLGGNIGDIAVGTFDSAVATGVDIVNKAGVDRGTDNFDFSGSQNLQSQTVNSAGNTATSAGNMKYNEITVDKNAQKFDVTSSVPTLEDGTPLSHPSGKDFKTWVEEGGSASEYLSGLEGGAPPKIKWGGVMVDVDTGLRGGNVEGFDKFMSDAATTGGLAIGTGFSYAGEAIAGGAKWLADATGLEAFGNAENNRYKLRGFDEFDYSNTMATDYNEITRKAGDRFTNIDTSRAREIGSRMANAANERAAAAGRPLTDAELANIFVETSPEMELMKKMQRAAFVAIQQTVNELNQTAKVIVDRNDEQASYLREGTEAAKQAVRFIPDIGKLNDNGRIWEPGVTTGYELKTSLMAYYAFILPYANALERKAEEIKWIPRAMSQGWIMAGTYFFEVARTTQDLSKLSPSNLVFAASMTGPSNATFLANSNTDPYKGKIGELWNVVKPADPTEADALEGRVNFGDYVRTQTRGQANLNGVNGAYVITGVASMYRWNVAGLAVESPLHEYIDGAKKIPLPDSIFNEVELMDINVEDIVPVIGAPNFRIPPCTVGGFMNIPCGIFKVLMVFIKVAIDVLGGIIVASINFMLQTVLKPFIMIIPTMFHELFAAVFERSTQQDTHPIINMAHVGELFLSSAAGLWIGFLAMAVLLSIIPFVSVAGAVVQVMKPVVQMALIFLGLFGYNFAYYIPLLPFTIFIFATVGWFIAVIECMVAAPIVALGLTHPEGQNEMFGKSEQAIMIFLNVFLRPSLMIIGFVISMVLSYVLVAYLGASFAKVYASFMASPNDPTSPVQGAEKGLGFVKIFGPVFMLVIFTGLYTEVVKKSFALIYMLPDQVLRYLSGGIAEQFGSQTAGQMEQGASQSFSGATAKVGPSAKEAGQSMSGAAKTSDSHDPVGTAMKGIGSAIKGKFKGKGKSGGGGDG